MSRTMFCQCLSTTSATEMHTSVMLRPEKPCARAVTGTLSAPSTDPSDT